jgi:2-phospho-L-lactate guanylyltransferase
VSVAAVVPVKALGTAKSRLGVVLGAEQRAELVLWLLERVVAAIAASGAVAHLAVVSPDTAALERAQALGAVALRQRAGELDAAVEQGQRWALDLGATALLVALGDLPLLTGDDIHALLAIAGLSSDHARGAAVCDPDTLTLLSPRVVLAPDRAGLGTNALLLQPPASMPFAFGAGSYARHLTLARAHGVMSATYRSLGTAFDVDDPADLAELRASGLCSAGAVAPGPRPEEGGSGDGYAR